MCGGSGTRLNRGEKPLLSIGGRPMIDRVVAALAPTRLETVYAVVSPNAPETAARIERVHGLSTIQTPGEGYVPDLDRALGHVSLPVLTVAADLPLLDEQTITAVLDRHTTGSLAVCVHVERKRTLGVSVDTSRAATSLAPTGVNVVGCDSVPPGDRQTQCRAADHLVSGRGTEQNRNRSYETHTTERMITDNYRLAVNVNRPKDAWIAHTLVEEDGA